MRILVQRVKKAKVHVRNRNIAEIGSGLLVLVGIGKDDTPNDVERLSKKLIGLRVFEDKEGKMNLDIKQINGSILSVPQFTLYADIKKGNRPGFERSAPPELAKEYWENFNALLISQGIEVKKGDFGSHMEIELINDGPVTIWMDSKML